jgi:hypothetical protein
MREINSEEKSFLETDLNFISPASTTIFFNNLAKPKLLFLLLDTAPAILKVPRPSFFKACASFTTTSS